MTAALGSAPLVLAGTFQLGEANEPQPGSGASSTLTCTQEEAWVNAKEAVVRQALEERDPIKALGILNRGYAASSPDVQKLIGEDSITRSIVAEAVTKTTAALIDESVKVFDQHGRPADSQTRADHVFGQLNRLVDTFNKAFAGMVVNEAVPAFQKFYQSRQSQPNTRLPDNSLLGRDGVTALVSLADKIAGSPDGDAAVVGFAKMKAWNDEVILSATAGGTGKAYAIAYSHFAHDALAATYSAELQRRLSATADHNDALADHGAQMVRIADDFAGFPAEQRQKAMEAYRVSMGSNWLATEEVMRLTVVNDGRQLIQHMVGLNNLPLETGLSAEAQNEAEIIASDPKACLAIKAAFEKNPSLIQNENVKKNPVLAALAVNAVLEDDPGLTRVESLRDVTGLLDALRKEPGPTGKLAFLAVRSTGVAATAFIRKKVLEKFNGIVLGDPSAAAKITQAISDLGDEWFAKILGLNISAADRAKLVDLATKASIKYADNAALLKAGRALAEVQKLNAAVTKEFNAEIDKFGARVPAFNRSTLAGQMFRTVVVTVAVGMNFVASLNATLDKPDAVKIARTVDLGLLAAQRTSDWLVSLGVDPKSVVGDYAAATFRDVPGIGRLLSAKLGGVPIGEVYLQIYTILEAANAVKSAFGWGVPQDMVQAGLSATSAVGFGLSFARAFGAAEWTGPVGMVIAAAAARAQMIYDGRKEAHRDEEKITLCLKAAGIENDEVAKLFGKQMGLGSSVPGHSLLPFLSRYANYRNLDLVDWLNGFTPEAADRLCDLVLHELNNGAENPSQYRPQPVSPDILEKDRVDSMKEFEQQLIFHQLIQYEPVLKGRNGGPAATSPN
jgi:hypothetical protein